MDVCWMDGWIDRQTDRQTDSALSFYERTVQGVHMCTVF